MGGCGGTASSMIETRDAAVEITSTAFISERLRSDAAYVAHGLHIGGIYALDNGMGMIQHHLRKRSRPERVIVDS